MACSLKEFSDLTTQMFSAVLDPREWQPFLENLSTVSGGVRTHMFWHDTDKMQDLGLLAGGYDPEAIASYTDYFSPMNPWVERFSQASAGEVLYSEQMCPRDRLEKTEFYNDWVRPNEDILGGGGSVLFKDDKRAVLLGGNIRRRDVDQLEQEWMQLVALLTPPLQMALRISRAVAEEALEKTVAPVAGRESDFALLVVSDTRRLLHANANGLAMLERGEMIRIDRQNLVSFVRTEKNQALQQAVGPDRVGPVSFGTSTRDASLHAECHVARIDLDAAMRQTRFVLGIPEAGNAYLLTLHPRAAPTRPVLARLGLTRAEIRVVTALAAGSGARELAERSELSIHTVRNQLKSAMSKIGVHSQRALVCEVLRLHPPAT